MISEKFVISKIERSVRPVILAKFELTPTGEIVFNRTCGDQDFVDALIAQGVRLMTDDGVIRYVKPDQGAAFRDACLDAFCTPPLACNDEADLERVKRQLGAQLAHSAA
ncbi:MAG: hypothetical protein WA001_01755 [Patescibacteria group bacterium]